MIEPNFDPIAESTEVSDWQPEKVFGNNWAEHYKERQARFGHELLFLNETLRIMYKLYKLRTDFFVPPLTDPVAVIISACLNSAILSVTKIAFARSSKAITLPKFRGKIYDNLKDDEHRKTFESVCPANLDIDPQTWKELKDARDKVIAHLDKKCLFTQFGVDLDRLLNVRLQLLNYFNRLAFPPHILYVPTMAEKVEEFVNTLAKNEPSVNEPEEQAAFWPDLRKLKSEDELEVLNRYRKKFGMPEA
jgi:hypothetical protein